MQTSTPTPTRTTPAVPTRAALVIGICAGGALATQIRINATLGERLGSSLLAAFVSFGSGLAVMLVVVAVRPATRRGLRRLRAERLAAWNYLSGVGGAVAVTTFIVVVPTIGVAVFAIAAVTGQLVGGLIVDRLGFSPAGRRRITGPRLAGVTIAIVGVAVTQLDKSFGEIAVGMIAVAFVVSVIGAFQIALNGRLIRAAHDAYAATTVHTAVAAITTGVFLGIAAMTNGVATDTWPAQWWLYLGGVAGVLFVAGMTIGARSLDVLRVALAVNGGQLAGALVIDAFMPGGPGVSAPLLVGAGLTFVAVAVASTPQRS